MTETGASFGAGGGRAKSPGSLILRLFAWAMVAITLAFVVEAWLVHWMGQAPALSGGVAAGAVYAAFLALAGAVAVRGNRGSLRADSDRIGAVAALIARWGFWTILLVGLVDATISGMRAEDLLAPLFGEGLATQLGQPLWRGPYVHIPIVGLAVILAVLTRGVPFIWLALLVVLVQVLMVIGRYVFSYEQPFLSDLVRLWYAAMFLLAGAYTLAEEGHVRVDVFYAWMSRRGKALVNGIGAVVLGMTMMWVILILGTQTQASTIVGPVLRYEQGQQALGMMTKYWMAAMLGIFAVTMMIQFCAYVLKAAADWQDEPDPKVAPEGAAIAATS